MKDWPAPLPSERWLYHSRAVPAAGLTFRLPLSQYCWERSPNTWNIHKHTHSHFKLQNTSKCLNPHDSRSLMLRGCYGNRAQHLVSIATGHGSPPPRTSCCQPQGSWSLHLHPLSWETARLLNTYEDTQPLLMMKHYTLFWYISIS